MPSLWKRGTWAVLLTAGMAGVPANAQQAPPKCATTQCGSTQIPLWPWPEGAPHHPPADAGEPLPTDPSQVPPPPEWKPDREPTTPDRPPEDRPPETFPPMDATPEETMPAETLPEPISSDALAATPEASLLTPQAGFGSPDVAFSDAPNMVGDLLRAYRSVTFSYLQAGDFGVANTSGAVNFRTSKVADNNSAIPRDRLSFRYNYFKNSLDVRGLQASPELTPRIRQAAGTPLRQFNMVQPGSRSYDVHLYTFGAEKTFFNDLASVEVRVPFARTLDSSLDLVSGDLLFDVPDTVPLVQPTPQRTLGQSDTEMQDMNVILKAIIAQDPSRRWIASSGLGITIPTGEDLNARVVDYSNDIPGDPGDLVSFRDPLANQFAFDQRTRTFRIENETWALSPFLAMAMLPTERTFLNGFVQVEVPLNSSDWRFRERDVDLEVQFDPNVNSPTGSPVQFDRTLTGDIDDQTLLHLDIGGGYWWYRNPRNRLLTGLATLLELHYTTTLEDADIVVIPETPVRTSQAAVSQVPGQPPIKTAPGGLLGPLDPPRLGNIANRVDILNLTMGSHVLIGRNAAISTAYVVPLRDDFDRTFDGELSVQLNLYR